MLRNSEGRSKRGNGWCFFLVRSSSSSSSVGYAEWQADDWGVVVLLVERMLKALCLMAVILEEVFIVLWSGVVCSVRKGEERSTGCRERGSREKNV